MHTVPCQHPLALPETPCHFVAELRFQYSVLELSRATMPQLPPWTTRPPNRWFITLSIVQPCACPGPIPSCPTGQARNNYMYVDKRKSTLGIQIQTCRPQYVIRGLCHGPFICPSTKNTPPREVQRCPPSPTPATVWLALLLPKNTLQAQQRGNTIHIPAHGPTEGTTQPSVITPLAFARDARDTRSGDEGHEENEGNERTQQKGHYRDAQRGAQIDHDNYRWAHHEHKTLKYQASGRGIRVSPSRCDQLEDVTRNARRHTEVPGDCTARRWGILPSSTSKIRRCAAASLLRG